MRGASLAQYSWTDPSQLYKLVVLWTLVNTLLRAVVQTLDLGGGPYSIWKDFKSRLGLISSASIFATVSPSLGEWGGSRQDGHPAWPNHCVGDPDVSWSWIFRLLDTLHETELLAKVLNFDWLVQDLGFEELESTLENLIEGENIEDVRDITPLQSDEEDEGVIPTMTEQEENVYDIEPEDARE